MTSGHIDPTLLKAMLRELSEHVLPNLEPEDRFTGAMLKRAINVISNEQSATKSPEARLCQTLAYENTAKLSKAIRERQISAEAALAAALRTYVENKLRLSNPGFLEKTKHHNKRPDT